MTKGGGGARQHISWLFSALVIWRLFGASEPLKTLILLQKFTSLFNCIHNIRFELNHLLITELLHLRCSSLISSNLD